MKINITENQNACGIVFFYAFFSLKRAWLRQGIKKPALYALVFRLFCGERGIRTPGGVTLNSFQDCRIRPLCHFSWAVANIVRFCRIIQVLKHYFNGLKAIIKVGTKNIRITFVIWIHYYNICFW